MKNIIVAMDFSTGAMNALDYGINIANKIHSDLILVWIDTQSVKEVSDALYKNELRRDAKLDLQKILDEKSSLLEKGKMSIKMRKGKVYQELALQAKTSGTEIIVVGTHGISGFEEFWIGSNAFKIVSYASCPVVSVRVDYDINQDVNTIVLPMDNSSDSLKKVPTAVKLAKAFHAKIHLLSIYTTSLTSLKKKVDRSSDEAEKYILKENVPYEIKRMQSNNLPVSVINYAKEVNADMVVIMTDQEKANLSILMGDYSQKIINLSTMPVLSVKPENLFL